MAGAGADDAVASPRYAIGIDPGTVNCGIAVYDMVAKKCTKLIRAEFRATGTGGDDIGHQRLLISVTAWMQKKRALFDDAVIFIENQPPEAMREVFAVQAAFQTLFGPRCKAVNPSAYKKRLSMYFPIHPRISEFAPHRRKDNQKAYDRKNAELNGRKLIASEVVDKYEDKNYGHKVDDAFEAFFIAMYGSMTLMRDDGKIARRPTPAPRRKKADGPHKRGRIPPEPQPIDLTEERASKRRRT